MSKKKISKVKKTQNKDQQAFLKDADLLFSLPTNPAQKDLVLTEYPFDAQLITMSDLYQKSRKLYVAGGGKFEQKLCSVARSLSSQDLFKEQIEYSPILSEMLWFKDHHKEVAESETVIPSYKYFNGISLYHEQNHRIVWKSLPPAPSDEVELRRYLNFAESLVIVLDLALADQVGKKLSYAFERMKTIYRTGGEDDWYQKSKSEYRRYLYANLTASYYLLELYSPKDIPKGLQNIFSSDKKLIKDAMKRSLDLSELFTQVTNPLWQDLYWHSAEQSLSLLHADSKEEVFYLPEHPLDFGEDEFEIADRVLDLFGL